MIYLYKLKLKMQGNKALSREQKTRLAEYIESVGKTINPMWGFRPEYQKETAVLVFLSEVLSLLADGVVPVFSAKACSHGAYSGTETWTIEAGKLKVNRIDNSRMNESWQRSDHEISIDCLGFPDGLSLEWNGGYNADSPLSEPTVTIKGITESMSKKITDLANQMFKKCSISLDRSLENEGDGGGSQT